jgi:cytoskeletal protein RodZ
LGDLLRHARESKGLTVQTVSGATKIREHILIALETETFEELPAPVFVRGFLRTLARYLGLNAEELLGLYAQATPVEAQVPSDPELLPAAKEGNGIPVLPRTPGWLNPTSLVTGLIAILVVAGVVWGGGQIAQGLVAQGNPLPVSIPTATPLPSLPPTPAADTPLPATSAPVPTPSLAPVISFASPTPTAAPQPAFEVRLDISARSWVKVEVDGVLMHEGVLESGTSKTYKAQKRVTMRAGNAAGVNVFLNGQPQPPLGGEGDVADRQWVVGDKGAVTVATPTWTNPPSSPTPSY